MAITSRLIYLKVCCSLFHKDKRPLQIFKRGGLTSMTGNDVVTGTELTRFDMEIGAELAKGREYEVGLLADTNFELPTI